MSQFETESPENYEQKCCCVLVLDVSYSMVGDPIQSLNSGIQGFHEEILNDSTLANRLEISVVAFSDTVDVLVDPPSLAGNFTMPLLTVKGSTRLVDGVRTGIQIARDRKSWYKSTGQPYNRPWVILITDGAPDKGQDVTGLTNEINTGMKNKEFNFMPIGVEAADMKMLQTISHTDMSPCHLNGLKFSEFFKWLSSSMSAISNSKDGDKINLPQPTWMTGFTV